MHIMARSSLPYRNQVDVIRLYSFLNSHECIYKINGPTLATVIHTGANKPGLFQVHPYPHLPVANNVSGTPKAIKLSYMLEGNGIVAAVHHRKAVRMKHKRKCRPNAGLSNLGYIILYTKSNNVTEFNKLKLCYTFTSTPWAPYQLQLCELHQMRNMLPEM